MFAPETAALIPDHNAKKLAQWRRIQGSIPGLQCVRSGEKGSQFMLTCSLPDFYESVIFGQLPQVVYETYGPTANPRRREVTDNAKKPTDKQAIDLTDAEIDSILACWKDKRSAIDLKCVVSVWDANGQERVKR